MAWPDEDGPRDLGVRKTPKRHLARNALIGMGVVAALFGLGVVGLNYFNDPPDRINPDYRGKEIEWADQPADGYLMRRDDGGSVAWEMPESAVDLSEQLSSLDDDPMFSIFGPTAGAWADPQLLEGQPGAMYLVVAGHDNKPVSKGDIQDMRDELVDGMAGSQTAGMKVVTGKTTPFETELGLRGLQTDMTFVTGETRIGAHVFFFARGRSTVMVAIYELPSGGGFDLHVLDTLRINK